MIQISPFRDQNEYLLGLSLYKRIFTCINMTSFETLLYIYIFSHILKYYNILILFSKIIFILSYKLLTQFLVEGSG